MVSCCSNFSVISTQHSKDVNLAQVKDLCMPYIDRSIPKILGSLDEKEIYINPTETL